MTGNQSGAAQSTTATTYNRFWLRFEFQAWHPNFAVMMKELH